MTVQNGGKIDYQYQITTAKVAFQSWFKWLSLAIIILGVLLFFISRAFTHKLYSKPIVDIIDFENRSKKRELFLQMDPYPQLRMEYEVTDEQSSEEGSEILKLNEIKN